MWQPLFNSAYKPERNFAAREKLVQFVIIIIIIIIIVEAFEKLRKCTISFMPVCMSVRREPNMMLNFV